MINTKIIKKNKNTANLKFEQLFIFVACHLFYYINFGF